MYFCIENYSERGLRIIVATTEIINKALGKSRGFFTFQPECAHGLYFKHHLKNRPYKGSLQK